LNIYGNFLHRFEAKFQQKTSKKIVCHYQVIHPILRVMKERGVLPTPDLRENCSDFLHRYLREHVYLNIDNNIKFMSLKPYEHANIRQAKLSSSQVLPTAKYVLRKNLALIEALDEELSKKGVDIFNLKGIVKIDDNNLICPPILEIWEHSPFNGRPVIVDGGHRFFIAKKRGISINCVLISGNISIDLPVLPLGGWHEVKKLNKVPNNKRNYNPNIPIMWKPHELYRQPLPGSTGPRTTQKT